VSLTIQRFVTRCRASPATAVRRAQLENVVRKEFATESARRLERSHLRGVFRLRDLRLRVKISRADFSAGRLPAIWAETFAAELARTTGSGGDGVIRAENPADWFATFIGDLLAGRANQRWEYAEFRELFELSPSDAILRLLGDRPEETIPVLELLGRRGDLPGLLAAFDEATLERLFALSARVLESAPVALETEDLIVVGRLVSADPESRRALTFATRRRALRLWFAGFSSLSGQSASVRFRTPDDVLILLKCLDWLRGEPGSIARSFDERALDRLAITQRASERFRRAFQSLSSPQDERNSGLSELRQVIGELRLLGDRASSDSAPWLDSNAAGVLLLIGMIERLGWRLPARHSLHNLHRGDAETALFAALGLAVLGRSSEARMRLDPAVAILAGWPEEAASFEVTQFLEDGPTEDRRALLLDLLGDLPEAPGAEESWAATIELLAEHLIRAFAQRLRGFGKARRAFLVKQFLAIPGRIRVEERRIQVVLAAQPLHIVLRLATMDATLESVTWLGGRRVEFYLQGL
jgi:hypothetical protein